MRSVCAGRWRLRICSKMRVQDFTLSQKRELQFSNVCRVQFDRCVFRSDPSANSSEHARDGMCTRSDNVRTTVNVHSSVRTAAQWVDTENSRWTKVFDNTRRTAFVADKCVGRLISRRTQWLVKCGHRPTAPRLYGCTVANASRIIASVGV